MPVFLSPDKKDKICVLMQVEQLEVKRYLACLVHFKRYLSFLEILSEEEKDDLLGCNIMIGINNDLIAHLCL